MLHSFAKPSQCYALRLSHVCHLKPRLAPGANSTLPIGYHAPALIDPTRRLAVGHQVLSRLFQPGPGSMLREPVAWLPFPHWQPGTPVQIRGPFRACRGVAHHHHPAQLVTAGSYPREKLFHLVQASYRGSLAGLHLPQPRQPPVSSLQQK